MLPFFSEEILSGFEDIVSSGTDRFTAWVKTDPHATLVRHMVDVQKATADFREASERRHDTPSQTNHVNKHFATRSLVQKRLSICNWNPGPRRGKEDAFEKQIAGWLHVITLQEASEYVDHDIIYWSVPRDPLRRMRDSLQQGHLLPQDRRQIHLPS